jgi:dihydrofolate reductase
MRKIILFIASSLDGFIAGKSGEIDWLFTDQDYGYTKFFNTIGVVIMGRKTYDQALTFGEYPFKGKESFVFSRSRADATDENVKFISGDVAIFVDSLRSQHGKDIWLVGGSELIQQFLKHDLIDEFVISIHPIILGEGIPLFPIPNPLQKLHLEQCETFDTGLVQITYSRNAPEGRQDDAPIPRINGQRRTV